MSIPKPGTPVRGSKTGVPIMALFDLLGRPWAMGVLWQLSGETLSFRQLQQKCEDISPTILNTRLKDLREAGFVTLTEKGYQLTEIGNRLKKQLEPLGDFSFDWSEEIFHYTGR